MDPITPQEHAPRRDKIRSAWISFAGRIVAQIIGAVATVMLGVIVFGGRQTPTEAAGQPASTVLIATPIRTHGETVIVMLPLGKDGSVDQELARNVAESYEKTKAGRRRPDVTPQTPIDLPAPQSADPWADSRATPESPRE
jgi:hypothetical protein